VTNDLQADLAADLLNDLSRPAPLPSTAPARPPLPSAPTPSATPALSLTLTPLRWSLPTLDSTERGLGVAVRLGPWRVEVAL
jgi:hypothetical protein